MPRFVADPGRQLPDIILANAPARPAFYTPGCTGNGSERVLIPNGISYEAHPDPAEAARARARWIPFPAVRLRDATGADMVGDPMSANAGRVYGLALAYHGAAALVAGRFAEAEHSIREALRLPMLPEIRGIALTHLGMTLAATRRVAEAEPIYRQALALRPDLGTAMLQLAKALAVMRRDPVEIRNLLFGAARHPEYLTPRDRQELMRFVGTRL
jgi:tetratricopeptide (TPR) repeat protein